MVRILSQFAFELHPKAQTELKKAQAMGLIGMHSPIKTACRNKNPKKNEL
jgi:hypothetical protein